MDKDKLIEKSIELLEKHKNDQFFADVSKMSEFELKEITGDENEGIMLFNFDFNYWLTNESQEAELDKKMILVDYSEEWNIDLDIKVKYQAIDGGYLITKQSVEGEDTFIGLEDERIINEEDEEQVISQGIEPVDFVSEHFEKNIKDNSGLKFINESICMTSNMIDDFSEMVY